MMMILFIKFIVCQGSMQVEVYQFLINKGKEIGLKHYKGPERLS